jgi:hypothetical protein
MDNPQTQNNLATDTHKQYADDDFEYTHKEQQNRKQEPRSIGERQLAAQLVA